MNLKDGEVEMGNLVAYDEHMNIMIEKADRHIFIRGDLVVCVIPN